MRITFCSGSKPTDWMLLDCTGCISISASRIQGLVTATTAATSLLDGRQVRVAVPIKRDLRDRRHSSQCPLGELPVGVDRWPRLTVLVALDQEHVDLFRFH